VEDLLAVEVPVLEEVQAALRVQAEVLAVHRRAVLLGALPTIIRHAHQIVLENNVGITDVEEFVEDDDTSDDRHGNVKVNITNNLIYDVFYVEGLSGTNSFLAFYYNSLSSAKSNYNLFYDPTSANIASSSSSNGCGTTYSSLVNWQATGNGANSVYANPLFVNYGQKNFKLQASSPAIDRGKLIMGFHCALSDNNGGSSLTNCVHWCGSAPDIGAFEYCG